MSLPSASVGQLWRLGGGSPTVWMLLVTYNLALGSVVLAGGSPRVAGPSFTTVRETGGPLLTGTVFIVVGLLLAASVIGPRRLVAAAYALGALAHTALAAGFTVAVLEQPNAAATGVPTYVLVSLLHLANARLYWHFRRGDVA